LQCTSGALENLQCPAGWSHFFIVFDVFATILVVEVVVVGDNPCAVRQCTEIESAQCAFDHRSLALGRLIVVVLH
jgi:hypothetical protein